MKCLPSFRSIRPTTLCRWLFLAGALATLATGASPRPARANAEDLPGGQLEVLLNGKTSPLPVLKSDAVVRIQGDVASVRLTQIFANPHRIPLHARYVFPLPSRAAVHAMRLVSGDEQIEAEIREKREARAVFDAAKSRGNSAALLTQQRPNVFTQEVANLMPGAPIAVEIEYAHTVTRRDGAYHFHFPMVVGPRFLPNDGEDDGAGGTAFPSSGLPSLDVGEWNLPASAPVAASHEVDDYRVSLHIELEGGMPIRSALSPSHAIQIERAEAKRWRIDLASGRVIDDRDFVLRYRVDGDGVRGGSTTASEGSDGFLSLLIEPPRRVADAAVTPRELVFVLDCSGSMSGVPMEASKRFMRRSLPGLRPSDHFRIIRFSDAASEWSRKPLPATPDNVRSALGYVDGLLGSGGTVMTSGIRLALAPQVPEGALRIVVFLTDGYIGNDVEIVRMIQQERGDARFFSFGVGSGVNRYLIQEMARVGRGAARIVLPGEDADQAAEELAVRLATPVWTDVEIDWGSAPVRDVSPEIVPDLFLGQSLRVLARFDNDGTFPIVVRARQAGRPVELPLSLSLTRGRDEPSALPIVWARAQIEDRMVSYLDPAHGDATREELRAEVTDLGLHHRLVTQWTSFVAVARPVVNPGGTAIDADIAVPPVHGVSESAYPADALRSAGTTLVAGNVGVAGFNGSAAPEPGTWLTLGLAALLWRLALGQVRSSRTTM